jgi:hypothetical protein
MVLRVRLLIFIQMRVRKGAECGVGVWWWLGLGDIKKIIS